MAKAYPQIRVFISSTFLDMQKERVILNQEVFPVVKGLCDSLGVAFNMIDLRWGITKDDQEQGRVLALCLDEIQHCKPYFIGLLGNRYGSILDECDPDLEERYAFLKANRDKSVTEMEMILGALSEENRERCFFYYKDPSLFDASHNDGHDEAIEDLKQRIDSLGIRHAVYGDYDGFKQRVEQDLIDAIRADYPQGTDMDEVRQEAYINLHESGYIDRPSWEEEAMMVIAFAREHHVPVMALTPVPSGKTSTFNHLINDIEGADKIIINFEADVHMRFFPAHYLYYMIRSGLEEYGYELPVLDDFPEPEYLNNYESYVDAMLTILKQGLLAIEYRRPMYILINDAQMCFKKDRLQTFHDAFLFDQTPLPENLCVILTANDFPHYEAVGYRMNPDCAAEENKDFFIQYLAKFGKRIDRDILDGANPNLSFGEYKLAADYLILYCNFSSYVETARELLTKEDHLAILRYIYDRFIDEMDLNCGSVFTEILLRLNYYEPGLSERDLFASYHKDTALERTEYQVFVDLTEIDKATIMRALRYFTNTESGVVYMSDPYVWNFIAESKDHFTEILGRINSERTRKSLEDYWSQFPVVTHITANNHVYTREEFLEMATRGIGSTKVMNYAIFDPVSILLDRKISQFAEELKSDPDAYETDHITDREIQMLVTIQEAAHFYQCDTRTNLYANLLHNVDVMLFVCAKSHALLKRLIREYIDLNIHIHKTQFSHVDKKTISFAVDWEIKNIMNANRGEYPEQLIDDTVDIAILVLEEYGMMDDKFLDIGKHETRTIATNDFVLNACSDEADQRVDRMEVMSRHEDTKKVELTVQALSIYFDRTSNAFDKLLYAYYIFRGVDQLVEAERLTRELFEEFVMGHLAEIDSLRKSCFFPEITGPIVDFLSRIKTRSE